MLVTWDALLPVYDLQGLFSWLEQRLAVTNLLDYKDCVVLNHSGTTGATNEPL